MNMSLFGVYVLVTNELFFRTVERDMLELYVTLSPPRKLWWFGTMVQQLTIGVRELLI